MFCQIRILDVLRLIKFQFYGLTDPYEHFSREDLLPRTIHLEIPYGCPGMLGCFLVPVFMSTRWHISNSSNRTQLIRRISLQNIQQLGEREMELRWLVKCGNHWWLIRQNISLCLSRFLPGGNHGCCINQPEYFQIKPLCLLLYQAGQHHG